MDDDPLPLRAAGSLGRWLWPTVAVGGFLALASFVLAHDDPYPGLSERGLLTIALAAVMVVVLTVRRAAGSGPLARALAEYAVVAVLAVLLATAGAVGDVDPEQAPPAGTAASTAPDTRPGPVKTVAGVWDWLAELWRRAEERTRPSSTTTPKPNGQARAPSPALPPSTRRPL